MADPHAPARSWWCRLRLHRWQRVTFADWCYALVWPTGRRCKLCGRTEAQDGYTHWAPTTLTPNRDADGYY
jgi:hypothetical protein